MARKVGQISPFNITALALGMAFLYLPIVILVIYSFNASRLVTVWGGWSLRWYHEFFNDRAMLDAAWMSLRVAAVSATIATLLGTLAAVGLVRGERFRGRSLDEPLAALDKKLRESTQLELMELQRRLGMTFIIVTHDQEEAMTMANRIGVMDAGRLEQVATPRDLYEAPATRWVAEFVGDINLFDGEVTSHEHHRLTVATRDGGAIVVAEPRQPVTKTVVTVAIRPEKVKLSRRGPASDADQFAGDQPARRRRHRCRLSRRLDRLQGQARFRRGGALVDGQYRADRQGYL